MNPIVVFDAVTRIFQVRGSTEAGTAPGARTVQALDREGKVVGEAKVVQVTNPPRYNRTPIIRIAVAKKLAMDVRNIRPLED